MSNYAVDTSVARKYATLLSIAQHLARVRQNPLVIPVLVHAEMCAHLRRRHGRSFRQERIDGPLDTIARIVPFDTQTAELGAMALAEWHPTDADWQQAKRTACAHGLSLDPSETKRRCPATIDWYIAAHAAAHGWTVITDDGGPEWGRVATVTSRELLARLAAIPTPG